MRFQRTSGVLLHVSSLPSKGGIGDLGPAAHAFVEFLAAAHQHVWQVLPLAPTGFGNSPYATTSAFAGNPYLLSLETLADWGWIAPESIGCQFPAGNGSVDFEEIEACKLPLLDDAAQSFLSRGATDPGLAAHWKEFEAFKRVESGWLDDYALYAALRRSFGTGAWTAWPEPLKRREPAALEAARQEHALAIAREQALQFAFALQWKALRDAAARRGIRIMGDVAIFVNMDSADVWVHPEIFELDQDLAPIRIAGVPPDYFSPTGQRWGNPLYRWDELEKQGYTWWIARLRRSRELYDIIRLDHFRGFEAYWAIPAAEETAVKGEWVKGPGIHLFRALDHALGAMALVAEDLGVITPEVEELRVVLNLPGMRVLQFGFADKGGHLHLSHHHTPDTVAYTGTHDNDTTRGWLRKMTDTERAAVESLVGQSDTPPVWPLIRMVEASVAELAIIPAQDLLELGSEARMNTPSVATGNWIWRAPEDSWADRLARKFAALVEVTDRDNDPLAAPDEPVS